MTGAEILPIQVTKATIAAAQKALAEDQSVNKQLREIANDSPTMKVAAEKYARRIAIKQSLLLKLYQPLAKWAGFSKTYFESDFASDMAEKISDIPDADLTSPPPSVAVPAMQGLGYSLDEPMLKEMYLNLLATATDSRRGDEAHPSFAEIIRQLSGPEAALLSGCLPLGNVAIVQVRKIESPISGGGFTVLQNHIVPISDDDTHQPVEEASAAVWVDNWMRLGLVTVRYDEHFVTKGRYIWAEERPEVLRHREEHESDTVEIEIHEGILHVTDFGQRFAAAVLVDSSTTGTLGDAQAAPNDLK